MRKLADYGVVCGSFEPEQFNEQQLSTFFLRAAVDCQRLVAGICRHPSTTFDDRVERVEALGCTDHIFFYNDESELLRELKLRQPHVRMLESSWRNRAAPGEDLADLRYYISLEQPERLLPRMSQAA